MIVQERNDQVLLLAYGLRNQQDGSLSVILGALDPRLTNGSLAYTQMRYYALQHGGYRFQFRFAPTQVIPAGDMTYPGYEEIAVRQLRRLDTDPGMALWKMEDAIFTMMKNGKYTGGSWIFLLQKAGT